MPRFACPFCSALTDIPDDWPHPGFTCCVCYRPVPFAPGMHPADQQQLDSNPLPLPDPHFVPVIPPSPWRWTPWFVVLLGAAIVGSVVAYLVTEDHFWLLALGIPAVTLLCILVVVWVIFGRHEYELPEDFPDEENAES